MIRLRKISLRKGLWFKTLSRVERGIVELTVKYVDIVRSATLTIVLKKILQKLTDAVDHVFNWRLEQVGRPLAETLSQAASSWGVKGAEKWKDNLAYIRCLGLNYLSSDVGAISR